MIAPMTDPKGFSDPKRRVAATFDLVAPGYDKLPAQQRCANQLVAFAALRPGMTVLDVGTGTGSAALAAARIVGSTGRVVGVDLATEMLAQARRKIAGAGLSNIELQEGDAAQLNFSDNHFDAVLCASSLFFLPDMLAAVREWQRVTKPGGPVAFSGFGSTFHQPLSDLCDLRIRGYGVQVPAQRRILRLADPVTCRTLLQDAGLHSIEVQSEQLGYYLQTVDEWWDEIWYSGRRETIAQLAPEHLAQFKTEHLAEVAELATQQGIWLDVPVNFARGRKPTVA
jgi:ubiquinone/menaquinone biosynthesis C-methylase UbiE